MKSVVARLSNTNDTNVVRIENGESKPVYAVDQKFLVKKFLKDGRRSKEIAGMNMFSMVYPGGPMFIDAGSDFIVSEYLKGFIPADQMITQKLVSPEQVDAFAADFIGSTYWSFKFKHKEKLESFPDFKWENRTARAHELFTESENKITKIMSAKEYKKVSARIRKIKNDKSLSRNATILHRDLHFGNILGLVADNGHTIFKIIDFEHFMEGPVELEFQNSIFWNDTMSLNVSNISRILEYSYRVPYSKETELDMYYFYFADQMNMAVEEKDEEKMCLLVEKYRSNDYSK